MVSTAGGLPPPIELPVEPPDGLATGAKAGPWIVERELGRGGMGTVYAVVHEEIGKRAALKLMHRRLVHGSSAERILLEARVVNQIGHPNIVDVFETGSLPDGRPYIVMERLEGVPLGVRADEGKILPDRVIEILLQICDALIASHAAGVVHRDLKVDNIFLTDGGVKVLDWGIAKMISHDPHHTIEGQLVGTPQYLAPEQARGGAVSPATDVYSLGVLAYELFLEQLPFEAETSAEIMAMHLRAAPPPPSELWPDIPPALEELLLAMLAKAPEARPSMLSVARSLEIVREAFERRRKTGGTIEPAPAHTHTAIAEMPRAARWSSAPGLAETEPATTWQRRNRRWHLVVGALALTLSATMFVLTRDSDSDAATAQPAAVPLPTAIAEPPPTQTTNVESEAPSPPPPAQAPATAIKKAARHKLRIPAKPRRDAAKDPDGTIDAY
jgi:serine/threonine-protein kinase